MSIGSGDNVAYCMSLMVPGLSGMSEGTGEGVDPRSAAKLEKGFRAGVDCCGGDKHDVGVEADCDCDAKGCTWNRGCD
jgi:hypothetical protein